MNLESLRTHCLSQPGVTEELPFGPDTLVFKVVGKVFLLTGLDSAEFSFNIKCEPEQAQALRERYPDVMPGYHMNKKHWNTVKVTGSISSEVLFGWVQDSYELVVDGLTKTQRMELKNLI